MNEWTKAQEADFQALIHRASEQSRECYLRRKDEPQVLPHKPQAAVVCLPVPVCEPPPVPCKAEESPLRRSERKDTRASVQPESAKGNAGSKTVSKAVAKPSAKASPMANTFGGLKALTDKLDNESLMLAMLLWLLIEEKADMTVILAIAYILLV